MHIKINSQLLAESIRKVERVVNVKHSLPILQGIYFQATNEELILIGSDNTEAFRYHIPVDGENLDVIEPGEVVIPKQISDISRKIKTDVELVLNDNSIKIKYGRKSEFTLNTFDPEEYPKLPDVDGTPSLAIKGTDFNMLVKKTVFAASDSDVRPILTGVNLTINEDCIKFVCTDSHRLGQVSTKLEGNQSINLVIPAKSLDKLIKTFDLQEDVSILSKDENQVIFKNGPLYFYTRLLQGTYPETDRLIPASFKAEMKIDRNALLDSLDRVSGLANGAENGKGGVVKLHVNGVANISTYESQIGKGSEVLEYEELSGEDDFTISFSAKYMIEALKAIDDDFVNFKYQGNMRPFLLTPCSSSTMDELQLILPVRTV